MILLIDNYDSFVFNLARYFERLGQTTLVRRNDAISVADIRTLAPKAIVLSPGPCAPLQAGCSLEVLRELHTEFPILGVCLGHQAIGAAWGGKVVRAPRPVHGQSAPVFHDGQGIFAGLPNPFSAGRYHSLVVEASSLPVELEVTARTADGLIMGLAHRTLPIFGVQFHPESILTDCGYELLANFLRIAGLPIPSPLPTTTSERDVLPSVPLRVPLRPIPY